MRGHGLRGGGEGGRERGGGAEGDGALGVQTLHQFPRSSLAAAPHPPAAESKPAD